MIFKVAVPTLPQFRFEWHPAVRRVYCVRLGLAQEVGDPIADEIADRGAAQMAVLVWCRGYRAGTAENALKKETMT